ncbi:hypothetical protein MSG28_003322 [Choristoneura fumiferana]|uniref:Uncharacterized protein n=1 Tax=Choristoneura fumiferana TaxID=7141 RepID=A0ACC0KFC6_CHOFU|nr:hypothetical protein MSG28_003322 [Choristoneura fumiferana]
MDIKQEESTLCNDRLQKVIQSLSKCKIDKESLVQKHNAAVQELRGAHEKQMEGITIANERKSEKGVRLEELEEKLKQSQFKQYLAQSSYPSESQVERPYSTDRDPYQDSCTVDLSPMPEERKKLSTVCQKPKAHNSLQVTYYGNKPPVLPKTEKKGQFNITKKRKLYNDKEFLDF